MPSYVQEWSVGMPAQPCARVMCTQHCAKAEYMDNEQTNVKIEGRDDDIGQDTQSWVRVEWADCDRVQTAQPSPRAVHGDSVQDSQSYAGVESEDDDECEALSNVREASMMSHDMNDVQYAQPGSVW